MDRVIHYRNLVKSTLEGIANNFKKNKSWEVLESYDDKRGNYLIFLDSWKGERREYGCAMHVEVKDNGKIYLRRDGTDLDIGQQLLDEGVPKSDMVIGFHSPAMRAMTDFAQS